MKKAFAAISITLFLLLFLVLNPFVQKQILSVIAKRVEAKTGWQIRVKSVKLIPWYGIHLSELALFFEGKQIFTSKEVSIITSLIPYKPYITIKKISLTKPLFTIEKAEMDRIIHSMSQNKSGKQRSEFPAIVGSIHKIIIKKGGVAILHDDHTGLFVKEINISLLIKDGKNIQLEKCSMTPEAPLIGKISCIGSVILDGNSILIRNLAINYMHNFANIEGQINTRDLIGYLNGSIYATNITEVPLISYAAKKSTIEKFDGRFYIKLNKNKISMVLNISNPYWGDFSSVVRVHFLDGKIEKLSAKNHINISTGYLHYKGFLNIRGFWNHSDNFLLTLKIKTSNFQANTQRKALSAKHISGKATLSPAYFEISNLHIQEKHGQLNMKTLVTYENIRKPDRHIQISTEYKVEAQINDTIELKSSAHMSASCIKNCTKELNFWKGKGEFIASIQNAKVQLKGLFQKNIINGLVTVDELPLKLLSKFHKSFHNLDGTLSARISLNGKPENPYVKTRGKLTNLKYGDLTARLINYSFEGFTLRKQDNRSITLNVQNLKVPQFKKSANLTLKINQMQNNIHFKFRSIIDANHYISCKGKILDFLKTPYMLLEKAIIKWESFGKYIATSRIKISRNLIKIDAIQVSHRNGTIRVKGILSKSKQSFLNIGLNRFSSEAIFKKLANIEISEGRINGNIDIKITNGAPTWKAKLKIAQGSIKKPGVSKRFRWKSILLSSSGNNKNITAHTIINSPDFAKSFKISISIPLKLSIRWIQKGNFDLPKIKLFVTKTESIEGKVDIREANLNFFKSFISDSYDIKGLLSINADINGTLTNPKIRGSGNIENASVSLPDKKYNLTDINGNFLLSESIVKISALEGKCMKGRFNLKGTVPISKTLDGTELELRLENFEIPTFYGITGKTNGNGIFSVHDNTFSIKGKLIVLRALLNLDELSQQIKSSISDIEFVEDEKNVSVITEDKESGFFEKHFEINVQVDLSQGNAWVKGIGVDTEVAGKLDIRKKPGKPVVLFGEIRNKGGWYTFQNVRIKIVKGIVKFRGLSPPDPELIITGEKRTQDVNIMISLQGSISEPSLKLSSTPPMSEIDILSYLLFNRSARQLTARESINLQDQAALLFGSKATRILKELLGNTPFSPDVLDFRRDNSGSEIVEVGKYITPDFYVTYEKDVKNDRGDQVNIEYRVNKHISVQSQFGGENQGGIDILWRYDFGE